MGCSTSSALAYLTTDTASYTKPRSSAGKSKWSRLPTEILLVILRHLPVADLIRCCLLSSHWHSLIQNLVFENATISEPDQHPIADDLDPLLQIHPLAQSHVQSITVSDNATSSTDPNADPSSVCTSIRLYGAFLGLFRVAGPSRISLSRCSSLTDDALVSLLSHCTHLTELGLSHCPQITTSAISQLPLLCPHLKSLRLSKWQGTFCLNLSLAVLETLSIQRNATVELDHLVLNCPGLVHLRLESVSLCDWMIHESLARSGTHMESLDISNRSHTMQLSGSCLAVVPTYCPRLKHLGLCFGTISDSTLSELARGCRQTLQSVLLIQVEGVMDGSLEALSECHHLESLSLIGRGMMSVYTEQGLSCVLRNCHRLKHLEVAGNSGMSDSILDSIVQCVAFRDAHLTSVCLYMFDRLTQLAVDSFKTSLARSTLPRCNAEFKLSFRSYHIGLPLRPVDHM
ncbi:hypothetical protein BASA84_001595 [Batrachochytrium salamandrivorans]|nr:hypothetical protein BASA84_001595 [Batrachochytrium salamandrivorans]